MINKAQKQKAQTIENQLAQPTQLTCLTQIEEKEQNFEDILLDINLKKPKTSFNYFILEIREKLNIKGSITDMTTEFGEKYKDLSISEKKKFEKLAEEDKERYKKHLSLVRNFIIDKPFKENSTPYSIFLEEKSREAREDLQDLQDARKSAKIKWKTMLTKEKNIYTEKKKFLTEFYDELKNNVRPINSYNLFIRDQMANAKEKNEFLNFKQISENWKKTSLIVKEKYARYAEELSDESKKHRDLYELAYGIKPKKPISAYRYFYKELIDQGKISGVSGLKEARKLWNNLNESEKLKYLKEAKRNELAYIIKKRDFFSNNKKERALTAINLFISDLKGTSKEKYSKDGFFNFAYQQWRNTDIVIKKKYESQAQKLKEEIAKDYDIKESLQKEGIPKRPLTTYNIYTKQRLVELKKQHPEKHPRDFFCILGEEYRNLTKEEKEKLKEKAETEKDNYEIIKTQFSNDMTELNKSLNSTARKRKNSKTKKSKKEIMSKSLERNAEKEESLEVERNSRTNSKKYKNAKKR